MPVMHVKSICTGSMQRRFYSVQSKALICSGTDREGVLPKHCKDSHVLLLVQIATAVCLPAGNLTASVTLQGHLTKRTLSSTDMDTASTQSVGFTNLWQADPKGTGY